MRLRIPLWLVVAVLLPAASIAHDLNLTSVRLIEGPDGFLVVAQTPLSKLAESTGWKVESIDLGRAEQALDARLKLDLASGERVSSQVMLDVAGDKVTLQRSYRGALPAASLRARFYPEQPQSVTVFTVIRNGQVVGETVLDRTHPGSEDAPSRSPFVEFLLMGISHIAQGYDHLAFIVGLVLLGGTVRSLLKTVTAFTVAHSITLSCAALGYASLSPRLVEPLIALSVVYVGVEYFHGSLKENWRPVLTFLFGLIHGFGFAGAFAEAGIPREALPVALGSFNLGVEVCQVAIILATFPLLAGLLKRHPNPTAWMKAASALGVIGLGTFWLVTRMIG
ncbi:MAG: HupE/UreJ family protein [Fimbriimonadaceae bacterium]|nr:HupE/UreJ family protein [Chthonomonadaceae bacterium]MCO5297259.1 HupE/UreJ family protein [Fimbriimonadaceae bacterium]